MIKSLKCIICKTTYNTYMYMTNYTYIRQYSVAKVDYRGAAVPKNMKGWGMETDKRDKRQMTNNIKPYTHTNRFTDFNILRILKFHEGLTMRHR